MRKFWIRKGATGVADCNTTQEGYAMRSDKKLAEAIRTMKEPLHFTDRDTERAEQVAELRSFTSNAETRTGMKRDRKIHKAAMRCSYILGHPMRTNSKRKGTIVNHQERNTINRIKG